jgi:hypothetical protein
LFIISEDSIPEEDPSESEFLDGTHAVEIIRQKAIIPDTNAYHFFISFSLLFYQNITELSVFNLSCFHKKGF